MLKTAQLQRELRWRGVALDEFTGKAWKKSVQARQIDASRRPRGGFFQFGTTRTRIHRLTTQTFFLEPLESPCCSLRLAWLRCRETCHSFVLMEKDRFSRAAMTSSGSCTRRISDTNRAAHGSSCATTCDPLSSVLLSLPATAGRSRPPHQSARDVRSSCTRTRAIVTTPPKRLNHTCNSEYGYSLEMKAGGPDPLADFLFNVKAGHCEYFSTAMAVMLRTRGIAARVVNGFLPGEYNEAAGAYTVRQSDAHSWVEVYFPETRSWVTFDPTPSAGRSRTGAHRSDGAVAKIR